MILMIPVPLLDTSVLIAHLRGSSPSATQTISEIIKGPQKGAISILTYYEIMKGAIDPFHKRQCKLIVRPFKIYGLTKGIADIASQYYRSIPKNERCNILQLDLLIAATAEYNRFHLITLNRKDFERFPLTVQVIYLQQISPTNP